MKTQDITKSGIDRNFLRACEDKEIISPKRTDSEWIVDKDYIPRDYSQEDVEKVWNAYLCRKMGLSYAQIKSLMQGEEISVRDTLNDLIKKYEKQIEELQALIEFMKYVKGIGFVPSPPNTLMGSTDFKNYLTDFIEYLDKDKKLKKMLGFMECISEIDDIQNPTTETIDQMETLLHDLPSDITNEFVETYSAPWLKLLGMVNLAPSCNEVQSLMHEIYYNQKQLSHNDNLTVLDFVYGFHSMLSHDSDMSMAYTKCFGEKAVDFFKKVLLNFLMIQEPDMFK